MISDEERYVEFYMENEFKYLQMWLHMESIFWQYFYF